MITTDFRHENCAVLNQITSIRMADFLIRHFYFSTNANNICHKITTT